MLELDVLSVDAGGPRDSYCVVVIASLEVDVLSAGGDSC